MAIGRMVPGHILRTLGATLALVAIAGCGVGQLQGPTKTPCLFSMCEEPTARSQPIHLTPTAMGLRVGESRSVVAALDWSIASFSAYRWYAEDGGLVLVEDRGCTELLPNGTRTCKALVVAAAKGVTMVVLSAKVCADCQETTGVTYVVVEP